MSDYTALSSGVVPLLRCHQELDVAAIRSAFRRGQKQLLYVLSTGGGKTFEFCFIVVYAAQRAKRIVILVHRQELLDQTCAALRRMGIPHDIIAAGYPMTDEPVQVASVMSLVRRFERCGEFDLIIIDEAHHAVARSWRSVLDRFPEAYLLGVTATPERLDDKGLGVAAGGIFEDLIIGPRVKELIAGEYLLPARTYGWKPLHLGGIKTIAGDYEQRAPAELMSRPEIVGDAVDHYERLCSGGPAIAYRVDVKHSELVAQRFRGRHFRAQHIDGETDKDVRRDAVAKLGRGDLDVLTNCYIFTIFTEGVDVPVLDTAILLRPTQSLSLYLQMIGRALRPAPGKTHAKVLDPAGNWMRHGLYDEPFEWSLSGRQKRKGATAPSKICPECGAVVPAAVQSCPECGFVFHDQTEIQETEGEFEEITVARDTDEQLERIRALPYGAAKRWAGTDPEKLRQVAAARGYKPGRAWYLRQEMASEAAP